MAKVCPVTQKKSQMAGGYSNATRATQFNPTGMWRRKPNFQKKSIFVPELGRKVSVELSTKGLRTLEKNGAFKTLKKAGLI
jgi:large subunit ribosomal protein L28